MKLIITDTYPKNGEKTFVVDSIYMDRLIMWLDSGEQLPDRSAEQRNGAETPIPAAYEMRTMDDGSMGEFDWTDEKRNTPLP
jgi:hypothetical protein